MASEEFPETKISSVNVVDVSTATSPGSAVELSSQEEEQMKGHFGCSHEQILSPIQIKRTASEVNEDLPAMRKITINESERGNFASRTYAAGSGGVVPYSEDSDPYFFNRFNGDDNSIVEDCSFSQVVMESDGKRNLSFNRN